jgi:hypothetical protein
MKRAHEECGWKQGERLLAKGDQRDEPPRRPLTT